MTDSLWGSPQVHVAEILGRLEKKAGLLREWLLVGLMNILRLEELLIVKTKLLSCL